MATWASTLSLIVAVFAMVATIAIRWLSVDDTSSSSTSINFVSQDLIHESADWDAKHNRFILSALRFSGGGLFELDLNGNEAGAILQAKKVAALQEAGGPTFLGVRVDPPRNRVLVVLSTLKKDYSGLAAYDLSSWELLFKIDLEEGPSFADDVAVDKEGNAYVTDTLKNRLWKVAPDGSKSWVLTDSLVLQVSGPLPFDIATVNGIVYHPDGYLLVNHFSGGALFKVSLDGASVQRVNVSGNLFMADGMTLLSPDKVVVASALGTKLVASSDGWETAEVTNKYTGPLQRLGTAVFMKDGKPYTSFAFGLGIREFSHSIREAVF
ncbi:unnamed protein product [Calypogeia fissa]